MSRPPIGPRVYVCLPADVLARVDAIARERAVSRGEVLREAVELYLSRRKVATNREK